MALAASQPCNNLLPTMYGVPLATPSAATATRRRQGATLGPPAGDGGGLETAIGRG